MPGKSNAIGIEFLSFLRVDLPRFHGRFRVS